MKFDLQQIKSLFLSDKNTQSVKISGNNNVVDQRIYHIDQRTSAEPHDNTERDDREGSELIAQYRTLASKGDSETALLLLARLKADPRYASGYFAFRLNFNIGIIQQNIGELKEASVSLRKAHVNLPENDKAKTGLALANFLDGAYELALEQAFAVLEFEGDHRDLATCIVYHAAGMLRKDLDARKVCEASHATPDVQTAYLKYLLEVRPEEYVDALQQAFDGNPDNEAVASMWSLSILDDIKRNQEFLLGAKMPDGFEEKVAKSAEILRHDLVKSLDQRPPNKLLLPSEANNAAVALGLFGNVVEAARLVDRVLEKFPELTMDLARIRAQLFLQENKSNEALELIRPLSESCELQVMASELEAQAGQQVEALSRINSALKMNVPEGFLPHALAVKARIGINSSNQNAADEALEDLVAVTPKAPELIFLRSAYDRAFVIRTEKEVSEQPSVKMADHSSQEAKLLASLEDSEDWDFFTRLQAAGELLARGYFRECTDLLRDKVSLSKESPALKILCDACWHGNLGSLAKEISDGLSPEVKNSALGWQFAVNVACLSGEAAKVVPLTRRFFEQNPHLISALVWYVQSLLSANDRNRVQRLVEKLNDRELVGTIQDRRGYVNLLVFCGEVDRARSYAYRLFCEKQNDHQSWLALSSSVLVLNGPPKTSNKLDVTLIQENSTFEVLKPDGGKETFTIETDEELFPLMSGNIAPDHPVAQAAAHMTIGEGFEWPFKGGGRAQILSVKHKVLAAFHMVTAQFEERFPQVEGLKSVSVSPEGEGGLDELKAILKQRAEYTQSKAKDYHEGSYPIYMLGHHLGIDPIDAFLGLKAECGFSPKVSSCLRVDQDKASAALKVAGRLGVIADACACYLMRRLDVTAAVEQEFGAIGVTQKTIDIFAQRLQKAENSSCFDPGTGSRKAGSMAVRDGEIILSERTEDEVNKEIALMRTDLEWLKTECKLIPAVATVDPDDAIISLRCEEGGGFLDDIFASDGSGRILISDDFQLRRWAEELFNNKSTWIQALLFHLEEVNKLPIQVVVKSTVYLCEVGEHALSITIRGVWAAAKMLASGELSDGEFELFCSPLGQSDANMETHICVAIDAIIGLWCTDSLKTVREKATSVILRNLIRYQGESARAVLDTVQKLVWYRDIENYIVGWRAGHFVAPLAPTAS